MGYIHAKISLISIFFMMGWLRSLSLVGGCVRREVKENAIPQEL
jgi:hypothetical protein